jgi:wyosine [tRNA(Phe)-imidazoG37] synthetase (radical SAM superfamily)
MSTYVFGPVPSRRLGRSLGVDLVPLKTCTYDCIYCQLGRTTNRTVERREYAPVRDVIDEVKRALEDGVRPDYITLSGSGEPTLHARIGELIAGIKSMTDVPVAVLTNGSLLGDDAVVAGLAAADVILPSLDVGDAGLFQHVNRPHPAITFDAMVRGLEGLRDRFRGEIWLEVLLLAGVTGFDAEVRKIAEIAARICPDRVQLNTAVRPTAEDFAFALRPEQMQRLLGSAGPRAEVIAEFHGIHETPQFHTNREDVLKLIRRRPCAVKDIAAALSLHVNEATKYVGELEHEGLIALEGHCGVPYYRARPPSGEVT